MSGATGEDDWTEGDVESNGVRLHYTRTGRLERSERRRRSERELGGSSEGRTAETRAENPRAASDTRTGRREGSEHLRTGGDEPSIVVAHGVYDDGPCRTPLLRELGEEYDVIAYDARGHGRSDAPGSGYEMQDRVDDLVGLIEELDLSNPVLFGHSMGGDTVAATAARHPDVARAAVLVDPACMRPRDDEYDLEAVAANAREQIAWWHDHTKAELLDSDDELRGHAEAGDEELASLLADARLRVSPNIAAVFEAGWLDADEEFTSIEVPTLVLRADEEHRERDRDVADKLANGRLVHVDGAGHCVFRDRREAATAELRAFLDEV